MQHSSNKMTIITKKV